MDDKTEKLIRELADKLGTTAEHLWGVLVRQAVIDAIPNIILGIVGFCGAILFASFAWHIFKNRDASKDDDDLPLCGWLLVFTFAMLFIMALNIQAIVTALHNPEYWALKQLWK